MKMKCIKVTPDIMIVPGLGAGMMWSKKLFQMYMNHKGKIDWNKELGVHRYTFMDKKSSMRITVFACITKIGEQPVWKNQIRHYVTNPYKMVKDLRTGKETDKIDEVLAGNLNLVYGKI